MNVKTHPQLNEEQKKAAFCEENAVVAAGAGSGKTMVLANRFAWLLTEKGLKVDEILTLTFTKKAAAQMFRRIYSLVSQIAENETGVMAERARRALDDFIHARIQTLDSYGASIVKQCAPRYGISPDFQIDQERCRALALEVSYPFFIAHRHHPAIERLYSDNGPNDIVSNIFSDVLFDYCQIDKPIDFSADVRNQFDCLCTEWKNYRDILEKIIKNIESDVFADNGLLPALVPIMEKNKIEMPETSEIRKYFDMLLNTPVESSIEKAESHPLKETLISLLYFVNSVCVLSLKYGKRSDNPVKENIKKLRDFFNPLSSLAISCMQAGFVLSIMSLLTELQSRYITRKRTEGVLTFRDVASLSRTILIEQEDIRQSEKESFKAIMIDEFQDNNELQKDILFLLAEKLDVKTKGIPSADDLSPGKLFFVGDEKQSIYLFRGADVSVFRKLKEEIKSKDLPLKINYRSSPELIDAFNAIFGGNLELNEKAAPSVSSGVFASAQSLPIYEASYTTLESASHQAKNKKHSNLSLCVLNTHSDEDEDEETRLSNDENEARFTSEKIRQLLNEKKYQPGEIAILFRSRSSQYLFEKHLRYLAIPYTCEDINDLFYGGAVNDIMSVLRLAAHHQDSSSYAEMLRSPFAGLSISGTSLCLSFCNKKEEYEPFDDKPLEDLDEADREKYLHGRKVYSAICEKAKSENISSLVSELWYNEGYRYETEWNPQVRVYRELFDYLFHLAANADAENHGLASFTDSMRTLRDSGGQLSDIEIPLERPSAVHLMTIHKSKGLEFPVVFLCGCGKKSQSDRCDVVYFSNNAGFVFSPSAPMECRAISGRLNNFFWEQARDETNRKRTAELRRLLYVGMTRAEKELYITGSLNIKETEESDNFSISLKKHIEKKCETNENYIEGDSILNNDTLFGLLLPSIVSHIPQDGLKSGSAFFNLEEIPAYTEEYIKKQELRYSSFTNDKEGLNEALKKAEPFYANAEIISTPVLRDNHITPVSLRDAQDGIDERVYYEEEDYSKEDNLPGRGLFIKREFSGVKADDVFGKVDSMLARFSQNDDDNTEKFNSGSFGTIAHICVEASLNGEEPVIPSNIAGFLNPAEMAAFLEAGMEIASRFVASPLGKIAKDAKFRESEFSFRTLIKNKHGKEIFINGTVDLFFEDKDFIHVVDFKTDNREIPGEHAAQMSCYYHAVSSLFAVPAKKECRAWIYYLRTGHAVEMTKRVKKFNFQQRAFND
jgi:ATP-dependent helicase/nuclease subunit A